MKAVDFKNITKKFGSILANNNVNLSVTQNTIHCIVGENGAGKSTLMKILFGAYSPDKGSVFIKEKPVKFRSPLDAIKYKIGMLYQHFMLIDNFTILENIELGYESKRFMSLDRKSSVKKAKNIIDKYNLGLNLNSEVHDISISERQKTEILKILYRDSDITIFDEPTAVLSPVEIEDFFRIVRELKSEGKTIILITHKLNEVKALADDISVMRKGEVVFNTTAEKLDLNILGKEIVGDVEIVSLENRNNILSKRKILEFNQINLKKDKVKKINNLSFSIKSGEIYGICGVEGNGQSEIIDILLGIEKPDSGSFYCKSDKISLVPDDRIRKGMISEFNIGENFILKTKGFKYVGMNKIMMLSRKFINSYDIRTPSELSLIQDLSGGNQQKAIFARELEYNGDLMIFAHPTRGVDINATSFIHSKILNARNLGKAVLLISSDLDEILKLSDKIGIIYKGEIISELFSEEIFNSSDSELLQKIGKLMIGVKN